MHEAPAIERETVLCLPCYVQAAGRVNVSIIMQIHLTIIHFVKEATPDSHSSLTGISVVCVPNHVQ